jgi:exopolyphosphatase/guanosine-5'-triphosphate,3'-diphosphate pyrophosphatase
MQSEILGISAENLRIIAEVCRYHRRATPQVGHTEYWALPQESRVAVSKIAAILRIADALDRNHSQEIVSVKTVPADDELVIEVKSRGDLLVDEWALDAKADLFREVFGLPVTLARS